MNAKKQRKYQKSVHGLRCLGPCLPPDAEAIHPLFLTKIKNYDDEPFCATDYHEVVDEYTGDKLQIMYDQCTNPTKDDTTAESLLLFQSGFTKDVFLKLYYDIESIEDMNEWLNINKLFPMNTKIRVVNASLNIYGDNIDYFDEFFVNFYIEYMKEKCAKKIFKTVNNKIGIVNNNVVIVNANNNKLSPNEYIIERINYIIMKFLNFGETKSFLVKIIRDKTFLFEDYDDSLYVMSLEHINHIKKMIDDNI